MAAMAARASSQKSVPGTATGPFHWPPSYISTFCTQMVPTVVCPSTGVRKER